MTGLLQRLAMRGGGAGSATDQTSVAVPMTAPLRSRFGAHNPVPQSEVQPDIGLGLERQIPTPSPPDAMGTDDEDAGGPAADNAATDQALKPVRAAHLSPETDHTETLPPVINEPAPLVSEQVVSSDADPLIPPQNTEPFAGPEIVEAQLVPDAAPEAQLAATPKETPTVTQSSEEAEMPAVVHQTSASPQTFDRTPLRAGPAQHIAVEPANTRPDTMPEQMRRPPQSIPVAPSLSIGRIDVTFEAPSPPSPPPTQRARPDPPSTRGFEAFAARRLGRRR